MRIMSEHLVPMHGLNDLATAVDALSDVPGLPVLPHAVPAPLWSFLDPLLVEISHLNLV